MARSKRSRARRSKRRLKAAVKNGTIAPTRRNPVALLAKTRSGAGRHLNRKKEASKMACRKPVELLLGQLPYTSLASSTTSSCMATSSRSW